MKRNRRETISLLAGVAPAALSILSAVSRSDLEEAKAQFQKSWDAWKAKLEETE